MRFLIRNVARTADGREIVRPTEIDRASISVGRLAENDIHLPDLAVLPRHAEIARIDTRRIEVRALETLGFEVDGRTVMAVEIDASVGAELKFGGHRLTVALDGDAVVVTVERVDALSDATRDKDEQKVFSLSGLFLAKRTSSWVFASLVLACFLVAPVFTWAMYRNAETRPAGFHADSAWSSGPLSVAHKKLENNCQACHTDAFVSVTDEACATCHKDTHDHANPARLAVAKAPPGFGDGVKLMFATAFNKPPGRCVECHTEHEGAGRMAPAAQQFCATCHDGLKSRLPDTQLLDAADFGVAHPEFRPALIVQANGAQPLMRRISFSTRPVENNGLKFPHALHVSKTGGVARMAQTMAADHDYGNALACKDCHRVDQTGTRFTPVDMERDCAQCHSLSFDELGGTIRTLRHGDTAQVVADLRAFYRGSGPERPPSLGGIARRRPGLYAEGQTYYAYFGAVASRAGMSEDAVSAVFSPGGACFDCHTIDRQGTAATAGFRVLPVSQNPRYFRKGWFDHDAHKGESCESCHAAPKSNSARDLLIPDLASCRTCHVGEQGARLARVAQPVESSCAMCHSYHLDSGAPMLARQRVAEAKSGTGSSARGGDR